MVRLENLTDLFVKLFKVLNEKNFSSYVKEEMMQILTEMSVLEIDETEQYILDIIEGLKKVETFAIDTREELIKIKSVKGNLTDRELGYVTRSKKEIVVVKENLYRITLVHELGHLSQPIEAYFLPTMYGNSNLFQKALLEGETCYNQGLYINQYFPSLCDNTYRIRIITHSKIYNKFLELYQDMREILGAKMLGKWKKISNEENFMLQIEQYMQEHYQCSFASFYQYWSALLYQYMKLDLEEYEDELQCAAKHNKDNIDHFNFLYPSRSSSVIGYSNELKRLEDEMHSYTKMLSSPTLLEQTMYQAIETQKRELQEYINENGEDDVAKEWQDDIEGATLEQYKRAVLQWYEDDKENYKFTVEQQKENELKKSALEYQLSFQMNETLENTPIEELEILKNKQLSFLIARRKQLEGDTMLGTSGIKM